MPTFDNPVEDAMEASAALRGLAHATRAFDNPAETYPVLGELLAGVRSLQQVLDQLASTHIQARSRAHTDAGSQSAGATAALAAADELHQAGTLLDAVHDRVDAAMSQSGRIAWHPAPEPLDGTARTDDVVAGSRWISVVFLQGSEADDVLDLIDRDGAEAAIEHLAGYDSGEETTRAALENGYVYDALPAGALDRAASSDVYTLTYSPFLGHVSLLREYDAVPDPVLRGIASAAPAP